MQKLKVFDDTFKCSNRSIQFAKDTINEIFNRIANEDVRLTNEYETRDTLEVVATRWELVDVIAGSFYEAGVDKHMFQAFIEMVTRPDHVEMIGPFVIDDYVDAFVQLGRLIESITVENIESRQHIITFPKLHCFTSIQFMLRDYTVDAICTMRSCNALKNFMNDACLTTLMANMVLHYVRDSYIMDARKVNVIMQIGSLHLFKSDLKKV